MNGIHEVTGSIPVWSTTPSAFGLSRGVYYSETDRLHVEGSSKLTCGPQRHNLPK